MSLDDQLEPSAHQKIFVEKILSKTRFKELTSQAHPKAVILAGQPGSGKGNLVISALHEFRGDVVTIDPDELREFHPDVDLLQTRHPYHWPTLTHPDASLWAKELREAAIEQNKNLVIDTTLGNGDNAVTMIRNLQSKGYDVEIRAMATHRLESEVGVDQRFTRVLDQKGYARYVPHEVREQVYHTLAASLDQVREQTSAAIRIYNRQGRTLYDSRSDTRSAGQALDDARDQPLNTVRHTRDLRENYRKQLAWHSELPASLQQHSKITSEAKTPLLQERESLQVTQNLTRDAMQAEQFYQTATRRLAIKGLGVAGAATMAYDVAQTGREAVNLLHQGNVTGAESGVLHFGSRSLGMATGAGVVGGIGAVSGMETGPGLFVTGAVGSVAGAIAGDKIADAIDNYRIYHQKDAQGLPWRYDPEHPQQGWVSDLPPLPDGFKPPVAHATLQNQLDYQASSKAAELRMAHPGELPDSPLTRAIRLAYRPTHGHVIRRRMPGREALSPMW